MFRRKFIKAASGTALAGLVAGCGGNGGGEGGGNGENGEETPMEGEETTTEIEETPAEESPAEETPAEETETAQETTAGGDFNLEQTIGNVPQGLEVANVQLQRIDEGDAGARVTGVIRNTGDQSYEQIEVQATLFDQTDDVLGAWFDNTEGENIQTFGSGDEWNFSIDFPKADIGNAARYRIDVDNAIDDSVWDWNEETTASA